MNHEACNSPFASLLVVDFVDIDVRRLRWGAKRIAVKACTDQDVLSEATSKGRMQGIFGVA
jgi:hypothetical protein